MSLLVTTVALSHRWTDQIHQRCSGYLPCRHHCSLILDKKVSKGNKPRNRHSGRDMRDKLLLQPHCDGLVLVLCILPFVVVHLVRGKTVSERDSLITVQDIIKVFSFRQNLFIPNAKESETPSRVSTITLGDYPIFARFCIT